MTNLTRPKVVDIFGSETTHADNLPVVFGTNQSVFPENIYEAVEQSYGCFAKGFDAVDELATKDLTTILLYLNTLIGYLYQAGVPHYSPFQEYPAGSFVTDGSQQNHGTRIYVSLKSIPANSENLPSKYPSEAIKSPEGKQCWDYLVTSKEVESRIQNIEQKYTKLEKLIEKGSCGCGSEVPVNPIPTQCEPTNLSFIPSVTVPLGRTKVMLRARLRVSEVNKQPYEQLIDIISPEIGGTSVGWENNTAHDIAKNLFLYSGLDLMRQNGVRDYFEYSPYIASFNDSIAPNQPITISGRYKDTLAEYPYEAVNVISELILETVPEAELPADAVDFVALQWGSNQVINSCSVLRNIGV